MHVNKLFWLNTKTILLEATMQFVPLEDCCLVAIVKNIFLFG